MIMSGPAAYKKPGNMLKQCVILAVLAIAVYANSLPNSFSFDDPPFILDNQAVHGFSIQHLKAVFTSIPNGVEYLPVKDLTYMLDYSLWGLNPFGYHLSNLIFFVLALVALYIFFEQVTAAEDAGVSRNPFTAAFLGAVIYAVHPVHTESVACASQRKDIVSGFLYFTALILYMKSMRAGEKKEELYLSSLILFILAALSKMTTIIMPFSVLLLELYFGPTPTPPKRGLFIVKRLLRTAPFFALAALLSRLGVAVAKGTGVYSRMQLSLAVRVSGAFKAVWVYLKILFLPYSLKVWHKFDPPDGLFTPAFAVYVAATAILVCLIVLFRKRYKVVSFSAAWMLTSMIPVVGLFPTTMVITERYMFLPSAGFCLALGWIFSRAIGRLNGKAARAAAMGACLLIAICSALAIERNFEWKNNMTLFEADLKHDPDPLNTYLNLGQAYFAKGDYKKGLEYLRKEKEVNRYTFDYELYLAYYQYKMGRPDSALSSLEQLRKWAQMDVMDADYLTGLIYEQKGETQQAEENYRKALAAGASRGLFSVADARTALERMENK